MVASGVTDPLLPAGDGHTPITPEEAAELIPSWIATRDDLYRAEQDNIASGLLNVAPTATALLDDVYLRRLHRRMFDRTWGWAGRYRTREMSLGIDPVQIGPAVRELVGNVSVWVDQDVFAVDEVCVRFHHQLVSIHPFVNGNGRHSRIAADLLARALGRSEFTWGAGLGLDTPALRAEYQRLLQVADRDRDDVKSLITFARS